MPSPVKFNRSRTEDREFHRVLKERVDAYFDESGASKHGNMHMYLKTLFWVGSVAVTYVALMVGGFPLPVMFGLWALLGFNLACIGFNVGHDAIHGSYSSDRRINSILSWSYELIGANARNWAVDHNVVHHTWTNVPKVDSDIEPGAMLRFNPEAEHHGYHRFQHLYAWFLYAGLTLNWVVRGDFQGIRRPHPHTGKVPGAAGITKLIVGKLSHFGLLLVAPVLLLPGPAWQAVAGFVLMHMVGGLTLSMVFQLAHLVEGPAFPVADPTGTLPNRWAAHQMHTTANFGGGNRLVSWIVGGLDYQVEHHLFPAICHVHYPQLAPIVARTAAEFGLPYYSFPTVREAIASHYRLMKTLSEPDGLRSEQLAAK